MGRVTTLRNGRDSCRDAMARSLLSLEPSAADETYPPRSPAALLILSPDAGARERAPGASTGGAAQSPRLWRNVALIRFTP
jgi:hypothetical protein